MRDRKTHLSYEFWIDKAYVRALCLIRNSLLFKYWQRKYKGVKNDMDSGLQHENLRINRHEPLNSDSFTPLTFSSSISPATKAASPLMQMKE
jgi:hypothetical protein